MILTIRKARIPSNEEAVCAFCFASLEEVRTLTASIDAYELRVAELHHDIKQIEIYVGYLHRAARHHRESHGQKVNV